MNPITKFFYERNKKQITKEMEDKGVGVTNEEKYDKWLKKSARRSIVNTIFWILVGVYLIYKWVSG